MPLPVAAHRFLLWPIALVLTTGSADSRAESWVVTDRAHPVAAIPEATRLILLDEPSRLEDRLSSQVPTTPSQAPEALARLLATPQGAQLQAELARARQRLADARAAGVERIPAVVVERRYVVYGATDAAVALQLIEHARSQQP